MLSACFKRFLRKKQPTRRRTMSTKTPQDTLIERARAGDRDAMTELLTSHGPKIRRKLLGRIGRQYRAVLDEDDVLQVTYVEAFMQIRRFQSRHEGSFIDWLARIADRNLLDAIKELNRKKRPPRERQIVATTDRDSYVSLLAIVGATSATPSQHAARHEAKELIDRGLSHLPPDYRQVLLLYHFEGLRASEVAHRMNRSEGAVFMLRARALDHLRQQLPSESKFFSITHPG